MCWDFNGLRKHLEALGSSAKVRFKRSRSDRSQTISMRESVRRLIGASIRPAAAETALLRLPQIVSSIESGRPTPTADVTASQDVT
jgi:hypothetical protein